MATTRIIPMHNNKGKTISQSLKARIDYVKNPEKHLLYVSNYIFNHRHKYDSLYISYDEPIRPVAGDHGMTLYDGCKHAVGGPLILDFVNAAAKYSGYDVADILKEIQRKSDWYDEKYGKNGSNGVEEH